VCFVFHDTHSAVVISIYTDVRDAQEPQDDAIDRETDDENISPPRKRTRFNAIRKYRMYIIVHCTLRTYEGSDRHYSFQHGVIYYIYNFCK
jgi:hypothetical protein